MEALQKTKYRTTYDPAIPLLGICPDKTIIQKHTSTPMFLVSLLIIAKPWKQPKCQLTNEWIRRCGSYIQWNATQP